MIFLEQNFINPVVLYLPTTNSDIEGHIFMFEKSEMDFVMFYIGSNLSNYISSYHLFEMELNESVLVSNFANDNVFNLMDGQYKYSIFETLTIPNTFEEAKELITNTNETKKISTGLLTVNSNEKNTVENTNVIIPDIFK